jgi:hypothetical protein
MKMKMRIRKERLKEIIEEEVNSYLNEVALCRNEKGHFSDCKKGATYSLSDKGAESAGIDKKFVGRGKVSRDKKKEDGSYWVHAPFGMNTSKKKMAGRIKMPSGEDINPEYSVSKYDEKYDETVDKTKWNPNWKSAKDRKRKREIQKPSNVSWFPGKEEFSNLVNGRGMGIFERVYFSYDDVAEIVTSELSQDEITEVQDGLRSQCRKAGLITLDEAQKRILRALNAFALAQDGKLNKGQSG